MNTYVATAVTGGVIMPVVPVASVVAVFPVEDGPDETPESGHEANTTVSSSRPLGPGSIFPGETFVSFSVC